MTIARGSSGEDRASSPIVAMRAYPAKAKNSSPADCSTPYQPWGPGSITRLSAEPAPDAEAATTTRASTAKTTTTITLVRAAVRVTPTVLTAASTRTAATATGFSHPRGRHTANVNAIAAQLAVLPMTNDQPAKNPDHGPIISRP
jgi:hypothetical protein